MLEEHYWVVIPDYVSDYVSWGPVWESPKLLNLALLDESLCGMIATPPAAINACSPDQLLGKGG
jgi:hypothetical protein